CRPQTARRLKPAPRKCRPRLELSSLSSSGIEVSPGKIVEERRIEQQAVHPIENAAVARQQVGGVLGAGATLQSAFRQITEYAQDIHDRGQGQRKLKRQLGKEPGVRSHGQKQTRQHSRNGAFPGFAGTYVRSELMFAKSL